MRNFKFNVLCRIISLLCVWFNVCECLEVDNIDNWIFTSDAEERLSEKCRKQFLGYITQHGDDQKNLISKLELFYDLNQHLPLTDLSDFPSLGDYGRCKFLSKAFSLKYSTLLIYIHQIDEYLNNITHGTSVLFKRYSGVWTASAVIGVCVPKPCTSKDILVLQDGFQIIDFYKHQNKHNQTLNIDWDYTVIDVTSDKFDTPKFSLVIWIFIIFTGFVSLINITSMFTKRIYLKNNFLGCFNLKVFLIKLLDKSTEPAKFQVLDGVRTISTLWVLYASIYELNLYFPNVNVFDAFEWLQRLPAASVFMVVMVLYQFQTINGFLMGYMEPTFGTSLKQRIFGVILPMYPLLLIFHTSLIDLGSGPMWFTTRRYLKNTCSQNVWTSYALIQNYYNPDSMCTIHTWYMSVDFHLTLASPILFFLMRKSFKMAAYFVFILTFLFCVMATNVAYSMKLEPTLQSWLTDYFSYIYFPTHIRSPVWLCSLLAGYAYKKKILSHYTPHLNKYYKHGCIITCFLVLFTTMFTMYAPYLNLPRLVKALYIGFYNLIWSLMILWIIFVYVESRSGSAGVIQRFLSMHIFTVLGRLSYGLYLIAPLVQLLIAGSRDGAISFGVLSNVMDFWYQLIFKLLLSLYWYLFIQSPIISLATFYFQSEATTKK